MLLPGVNVSLEALSRRAAQLPAISLQAPKSLIGKSTEDCMRSGIVYGTASMLDGIIDRIREEFHGKEVSIVATGGTARTLRAAGVECEQVRKIHEGEGNVRDMIAAGDISLMINTPFGHATRADGYELRLEAVKHGVTHVTNLAGAQAMVAGMEAARLGGLAAVALQDLPQWELSR